MKCLSFSAAVVIAFSVMACNSPSGSEAGATDSSKVIPAPVDNSNATNSSLADTTYPKKDTMVTKGDSLRKQQ